MKRKKPSKKEKDSREKMHLKNSELMIMQEKVI